MAKPQVGQIVAQFADEFPAITRPGAGRKGQQRTDIDVALELLEKEVAESGQFPSHAMKVVDYTVDQDGNPVELEAARTRAQARVQAQRKRGYTKDAGWKLAAIDGCFWAQYFGPGNHPVKEEKESAVA